jgi:predicted transcriptional regulator of viral defense system
VRQATDTNPRRDATGIPRGLAARGLQVFRTDDAAEFYAHPRPELKRLTDRGLLLRLHRGLFAIVPPAAVGTGWRPDLEVAAGAIAGALWDTDTTAVMGLSAARLHGVVPRALGIALVAAPAQHDPIRLADRDATVRFVKRDVARIDVERTATPLGELLVTTPEQTALDLAQRPNLGGAPDEALAAAGALAARADVDALEDLARAQHRPAAWRVLQAFLEQASKP